MPHNRAQILHTATALFRQHGYHAVDVDWISAESHVSARTMGQYFPSKGDLVVAVLEAGLYRHAASMEQSMAHRDAPLARLKGLFDWYRDTLRSEHLPGSMFAYAADEFADKSVHIQRIKIAQQTHLTCAIADILAEIVAPERVHRLAPALVMLLDGAALGVQVYGAANVHCDLWDIACQMIGVDPA